MPSKKQQLAADCKRFAYVHGICLSGNERTGIAIAADDYATCYKTWDQIMQVLQAWRSGKDLRTICQTIK